MRNVIRDKDGQMLDLDDSTGSVPIADRLDILLHAGFLFETAHTFNLATGIFGEIHFKTSVNNDVHLFAFGSFLGEGAIEIIENPSVTGNGNSLSIYNINRQSSNVSESTAFHTPAYTGGTSIFSSVVPGGRIQQATGFLGKSRERMLKKNTSYIIKYTNNSGATKNLTAILAFYEERHVEL